MLCAGIYFTDRCLLSAYDSTRSAWKYGIDSQYGKLLAYFLSGLSIVTSVIMFCFALPFAAKLFAISIGPAIIHHLPMVIDNALVKFANAITPTLTAIGRPLTHIIDAFITVSNSFLYYALPLLTPVPAVVGGSLFFATAIATSGAVVNSFINDFKAWWNYDPNFVKPNQGEGSRAEVLSQQADILCALGGSLVTDPASAPIANHPEPVDVYRLNSALPLPTASLSRPISGNSTGTHLPTVPAEAQNQDDLVKGLR